MQPNQLLAGLSKVDITSGMDVVLGLVPAQCRYLHGFVMSPVLSVAVSDFAVYLILNLLTVTR
jgi:hypothetical protein